MMPSPGEQREMTRINYIAAAATELARLVPDRYHFLRYLLDMASEEAMRIAVEEEEQQGVRKKAG
jgi:hypothetical protein